MYIAHAQIPLSVTGQSPIRLYYSTRLDEKGVENSVFYGMMNIFLSLRKQDTIHQ